MRAGAVNIGFDPFLVTQCPDPRRANVIKSFYGAYACFNLRVSQPHVTRPISHSRLVTSRQQPCAKSTCKIIPNTPKMAPARSRCATQLALRCSQCHRGCPSTSMSHALEPGAGLRRRDNKCDSKKPLTSPDLRTLVILCA